MSLATIPPVDMHDGACSSNSTLDYASVLEENKKLKYQLEKWFVSCIQRENNLNDLLINRRECVAKGGIGFDPYSKRNKTMNKKKYQAPPPQQKIAFVREGHYEKEQ